MRACVCVTMTALGEKNHHFEQHIATCHLFTLSGNEFSFSQRAKKFVWFPCFSKRAFFVDLLLRNALSLRNRHTNKTKTYRIYVHVYMWDTYV